MPIPEFDHNHVLPPYLGVAERSDRSPYRTTTEELVSRFAVSEVRAKLLVGFLDFRAQLAKAGFLDGFQWIDGSFAEDLEGSARPRPPADIDVVTFFRPSGIDFQATALKVFPGIENTPFLKLTYYVHNYFVDLAAESDAVVGNTCYWFGLFSHSRESIWKGMVRLELGTTTADESASTMLKGIIAKNNWIL